MAVFFGNLATRSQYSPRMNFAFAAMCFAGLGGTLGLAGCSPSSGQKIVNESLNQASGETANITAQGARVDIDNIPHAQLPENVVPQAYRIDMRMDPDADGFSGTVEIDVILKTDTRKIWLHGKDMTVSSAQAIYSSGTAIDLVYNAVPLEQAPSGVAYLTSEDMMLAGAATLKINYETPYNQALNSAYQVKRGAEGYIVTQFEPLGAREAFPSFDEPKFKVPFTVSITAPQDDFVYSNTPEIKTTPQDGGWVRHDFATTRPLPTYLVAFGAGPYDVTEWEDIPPNSVRDYPLKLRGIGAAGQGGNFKYALENTSGLLTALEEYFGTPYPYEKLDLIAAPEYAFGAMENPGAIVYREYLLLMDDNAPLSQKRAYARVHSHELAHQWFGNLVTPVWWEDIWLNEAFATWMGNKGTAIWQPEGNYDRVTLNAALAAKSIDTLSTTRRVREPLARSENVMDQFDAITYRKGGGVLSMFESYLGEEKFRDGVRLHMKRYADGVATGDDFFQSIADGSGNAKVVDAMKSFVDQRGLPLVKITAANGALSGKLNVAQSRYVPLGSKTQQGQLWQIPVCATLGYDGETQKVCDLISAQNAEIALPSKGRPDWIMPNADGAGYYRFSLDDQGWSALMDNIIALNTREALSAQDSLFAAFRAGDVDANILLKGQRAFAAHPEYDVVAGSTRLLGFMYDQAPDPQSRAALASHVTDMYAARFNAVEGQDSAEGQLLAPELARVLLRYGDSEDLRARFAKKGADYLGLNGAKANPQAVASNMLSLALGAVMAENSAQAYGPILELAQNGSAFDKRAALAALPQTRDPKTADMLRALVLAKDSSLTGRQGGDMLRGLMASEIHGTKTWDWVKTNFADYVSAKVPDVRKGSMPAIARGFCTDGRRDDVNDFFVSQSALIPGYERSLAQVTERIDLCSALKREKMAELTQALRLNSEN